MPANLDTRCSNLRLARLAREHVTDLDRRSDPRCGIFFVPRPL
jgi:hypothetical protein